MKYPVIIHKDENPGYGVTIPDIPGCFACGDTHRKKPLPVSRKPWNCIITGKIYQNRQPPPRWRSF